MTKSDTWSDRPSIAFLITCQDQENNCRTYPKKVISFSSFIKNFEVKFITYATIDIKTSLIRVKAFDHKKGDVTIG